MYNPDPELWARLDMEDAITRAVYHVACRQHERGEITHEELHAAWMQLEPRREATQQARREAWRRDAKADAAARRKRKAEEKHYVKLERDSYWEDSFARMCNGR